MIPIFAQAAPTVDLISYWLSGDGGMLGMSLCINLVLVIALRYMYGQKEAAHTKMLAMSEEYAKNNERLFAQILEASTETTASLTEVTTIVKTIAEGVRR